MIRFDRTDAPDLYSLNHTAGNLRAHISGGLGMKVIRIAMQNDCPADDLLHVKTSGQHLHIGISKVCHQRRQVPCMVWVFRPVGVEVTAGIGKTISGTASALMDMERKKTGLRSGQA